MALGALAAGAGISVLGGIAQYYQSEKARNANQAELDEIKRMFDAIKPPDYDVSVIDPPDYITEAVPEPAINYSALTPKQFEKIQDFSPQIADYVAEKAPTLVEKTSQGKEGRNAQIDALRQMIERSKSTGPDPLFQGQLDIASEQGQRDAQSRQQSLLQDAQRRGQFGSGLQFAAQLSGGEDQLQRQAALQREAAMEAYRQKIDAMRDSATLGGNIAQQDFSEQARNADIINDFNMRTSRDANLYNQYKSGLLNDAQKYNLGVAQSAADKNVSSANDFSKYNREMFNKAQTDQYNRAVNERSTQNQLKNQQYQNQIGAQSRANDLKSQIYANQMNQARAKAGLGQDQMNMNTGRAQDTNKLIQGLTDTALGGTNKAYDSSEREKDREAYGQGGY